MKIGDIFGCFNPDFGSKNTSLPGVSKLEVKQRVYQKRVIKGTKDEQAKLAEAGKAYEAGKPVDQLLKQAESINVKLTLWNKTLKQLDNGVNRIDQIKTTNEIAKTFQQLLKEVRGAGSVSLQDTEELSAAMEILGEKLDEQVEAFEGAESETLQSTYVASKLAALAAKKAAQQPSASEQQKGAETAATKNLMDFDDEEPVAAAATPAKLYA